MAEFLQIHEPGETPMPHADDNVAVGIDLGTTNSLVAIAHDSAPEILRGSDGRGMVPSVVAYLDDEVIVGAGARPVLLDEPERVVASIKRLMGRGVEDLKTLGGKLPYDVDEAASKGGMVRLSIAGRSLTPVEISADILRALKVRAEEALDRDVDKAVITVPAYFDDAARAATKDAAKLAGLETLRLVNEPTAAALAYGLDKDVEGLYAVYDFGGGTFDISLLRMEMGVFQVLATGGDAQLGGDDLDHVVAEHFLAERTKELSDDGELTTTEVKNALMTARLAKECLTDQDQGKWMLGMDGQPTEHSLDRARFNDLISDIVDRTIKLSRDVLLEADIMPDEVKGVVLVGGSTRVPLVRERVAGLFGQEPLADINPDEVVALGAALQAEALTAGSNALLLDVTPLSLGIETMGGMVEKVIHRNTPIPVAKAQEFTTYKDGQTAMAIHALQGEREMADQNRSLARFELRGIPAMVAGAARIKVMFSVDADGLLTVSASEESTGLEAQVEVKPSYGLNDDDMARMLRESMQHGRSDMMERLLAEARVEGARMLLAFESALEVDGDLLEGDEKNLINRRIDELRSAMAGDDRDVINTAVDTLNKTTEGFASRRMDRDIRKALAGSSVEDIDGELANPEA
ncbi:MAG: Fe-S protein assembly chaperone HscA [Alphaproteobacteria bacterium]|nr:Fe-S protein assembly chaperone HscA [Alphaproteobacteria bacterium]MBT4967219.1 Fe-S protein assembly chaperone HscA [Alphaproteobacteria bacterium]MBT5159957.1 Fe-S protein assembly chaperone HscA [Alphaproteobacteria bacterium]MBT6385488.1 Fe-S protein assembly chaperone HscA [Alphaproteobacteria bacterium]